VAASRPGTAEDDASTQVVEEELHEMTDLTDRITAHVAADGHGSVTVAGTAEEVTGWEPEVTRRVILARVVDVANDRSRPVELELDLELEGSEILRVYPSGVVETLTQPAAAGSKVPPSSDASASAAPAAPTVQDLLAARPAATDEAATLGWRGAVVRATGLRLPPSTAETKHREAVQRVRRTFTAPRTVVVINPKGGAQKTTTTLLLAATFGMHRGGYVLAWDNNETRGTLGWRAGGASHARTAVDLLSDLNRFGDSGLQRVGDLDRYVRNQSQNQFDVLASDEDAAASSTIDDLAFRRLHSTLARFYRVIVVDTGNNMRASNWTAAVDTADQLVIVSTEREDTAASAAWLVDGLREKGHEQKVRNAVTVLAAPARQSDPALARRLNQHFGQLTRAVLHVPYDPALVGGGAIRFDTLSPATREAWLQVAATVADGV
jgi:MinD-like ATPase involved in chromosome partitioning or flagellar assembly